MYLFKCLLKRDLFSSICCGLKRYYSIQGTLCIERLKKRTVLKLSGPDTTNYLQSMITNDIKKIDTLPSLYSLLLNPHGRVLYDSILYKIRSDEYLVEYDVTGQEYMHKHLFMYRLRKDVKINPLTDMSVWVVYGNNGDEINGSSSMDTIVTHLDTIDDIITHKQDPRNCNLGIRIISKKDVNLHKSLELSGLNIHEGKSYDILRYKLGIGEGVLDHPPGSCSPFDTNVDLLNGVSFTKGCYIGQEMTARSNYVFSVRKRLMPVVLEMMDTYPIFPAECNIFNDKQKKMGRLRSHIGQYGLAYLRYEDSMKSNFLYLEGFDIKLKPVWPKWWPSDLSSNKNEHIYYL